MLRLLPDKPKRGHPSVLDRIAEGRHIALTKYDGWSALVEITSDGVIFVSRRNNLLPVSDHIGKAIGNLNLESNTTLWGEWMERRPKYNGPECLVLFSPVYIKGKFVGGTPFADRFQWILGLGLPQDNINIPKSSAMPNHPLITPIYTKEKFGSFFEQQKKLPRSEGIVVYDLSGRFYGNPSGSIKSRDMIKYKYREGDDGRTIVR